MQFAYLDDPIGNLQKLIPIIINSVQNIQTNVNTIKKSYENYQKNVISLPIRNIVEIQDEINKQIKSTTFIFKKVLQPYLRLEKLDRIRLEKIRNEFHDLVKEYGRLQGALTSTSLSKIREEKRTNQEVNEKTPLLTAGGGGNSGNPFDESLWSEREQKQQEQRERAASLDFERGLAAERLCKVEDLEAIMLDVNQIFKDLGYMVREQGESLDTVESHLDTANAEVEMANVQLVSASHTYNSKYKKKVCALVIILLVILAIIGTIIAMKFKKLPRIYY